MDEKTLLWLSRETGTECLLERDVFIKGTAANDIWCYYAENGCGRILAYAIELHRIQDGKAMGNLYELNYAEHYERVRSKALNSQITVLVYEHGVKDIPSNPYFDCAPDSKLGKFKRFEAQPDDPEALKVLLLEEKSRRSKMKIGDPEKHVAVLHEEMIKREAWRIAGQFKKMRRLNRPDKEGFIVELSHTFLPLTSAGDLERLRSILPYQTLSFIHEDERSRRIYAAISKDERRRIRLPKRYE